ncbi:hypothetical protein GCM10027589_39260 [Actinocorallia lasiicapitis]
MADTSEHDRTPTHNVQSFPSEEVSVGAARRFVRTSLRDAGFSEPAVYAGMLITSEAATNAVKESAKRADAGQREPEPFTVQIDFLPCSAVIHVIDRYPTSVVLPEQGAAADHDVDAENGRGLEVIAEYATACGVMRITPQGKAVWARVDSAT